MIPGQGGQISSLRYRFAAFNELRTSAAMTADVSRRVSAIASACGEGYEAETEVLSTRARGAVYTRTAEAMIDNSRRQTLLRNIGAGR